MDVGIIFIALSIKVKVCARVQLLVSILWTSFTKVVDHIIMIIINILWTSITKVLTTPASITMHSSGEVVVATISFFSSILIKATLLIKFQSQQ